MAVKTVEYAANGSVNTDRGPSRSIWCDCPITRLQEGVQDGLYFYEEFDDFPGFITTNTETGAGLWTAFLGNNSAVKVGTTPDTTNLPLEGGVCGLTAGTNNNLSISLAANMSTFRLISPATGNPLAGKMWYECSFAVSTVTSDTFDLFLGLMDTGDAGTRITSAADLVFSAANTIKTTTSMGGCIGFWKRATTNPTDVTIVHNVNNGTAQVLGASTNIQKLSLNYAASTMAALSTTNHIAKPINDSSGGCFLKLGFVFDPNAPLQRVATALTGQTAGALVRPLIKFFVNGVVIPIFFDSNIVQASTFPNTFMAPVIGFRTGNAAGAGTAYVDFVRVAQLGTI